ncbi:SMI1/KNR4 family protein [Chitinilyticum piscinae]|uniref:SMI1/KNR4 family protein n=1 Tax=Chitinilyticum piscinae TaxID=2866724 RepID=A0A8J7K2H6_9NEIS|nr:SMI1/KNR4 family protein [Chitinilyticum piscinae]MBE9610481.1 SMI1/KNR4 family protein [Chitinilyticum piscinae]
MDSFLPDTEQWPPPDCPPLAWPALEGAATRLDWYRRTINAYAELWGDHPAAPVLAPVSEAALAELEQRLACRLPQALREWHLQFGVLKLGETLCSVAPAGYTPIEPLLDAFPGFPDLCDEAPELLALAEELVTFGDYLGNGNLFCFHRESGEVYYFDHDDNALLTLFFTEVETYLDALMLRTLGEIHDDDAAAERLLTERFGAVLVRKWLY